MKIKQVTVRAGRVLPHPLYDFSNIKCDLEYVADLEPDEDADEARRKLQQQAETDIENHAADLKESIRDFQSYSASQRRIESLEKQLEELKAKHPQQPLLAGFGE